MNEVIKSGHLKGSYRCSFKREHDIPLETGKRKENVYDKAVLIKEIIKNGIYHGYDKEQIKERIIQAYEKMDYPTEETARLHAMDTYRQVMRYLTCESRKPAGAASQKNINMDGLCSVEVRPDFIFRGYRNFERVVYNGKKRQRITVQEPYLEVVKICCKAPDVSQIGKNKDTGAKQNLELYSCLLYTSPSPRDS